MCRVDYGDGPDAYSVSTPIARAEHRCGECRRTILPGERYERHGVVYEGTASAHVMCSHCAVLAEWLIIECDGFVFREVVEDFESHGLDYNRADLKELALQARGQWCWDEGMRRDGFRGRPIPQLPPRLSLTQEANSK